MMPTRPGVIRPQYFKRESPLAWYWELSRAERWTFWGCFGGWSMDAMDSQLFSFVIPTLMAAWTLTRAQVGLLGTAALLSSAVGGWVSGFLGDRYGRVRVMKFTILWFAVLTGFTGLTWSFNSMLVIRILQGLGFGGEWAAGAVLMAEIIRPRHRGKAVGCVQSAFGLGYAAAALVGTFCLVMLPAEWGWRAAFFLGALPAFLVLFLRRQVREPEIFLVTRQASREAGAEPRLREIFLLPHLRTTILTSTVALGLQGGGYAIAIWLPAYLVTERHLSVVGTGLSIAILAAGSFIGSIVSAYLMDVVGRRPIILGYSLGAVFMLAVYFLLPVNPILGALLGIPLAFFSSGVYSVLGPFFSELFPTRIRGSGQSFAYNVGRCLGALFVTLIGVLAPLFTLGYAIGSVALACYAMAAIASLLLPETKGISLVDAGT